MGRRLGKQNVVKSFGIRMCQGRTIPQCRVQELVADSFKPFEPGPCHFGLSAFTSTLELALGRWRVLPRSRGFGEALRPEPSPSLRL